MPRREVLAVFAAAAATQVAAFGTIDLGDQEFEHERITRNALACADGVAASPPYDCFEPKSIDQLAGTRATIGAVGAPDADEIFDSEAHCDNADFLDFASLGLQGTYSQSREEATENLFECVNHLRDRIREGVDEAEHILNDDGVAIKDETDIGGFPCVYVLGDVEPRAKCAAIEGFGRALHGVQDFFAHSNWVDEADANRQLGVDNPPGLQRNDRPAFLSLTDEDGPSEEDVPRDLATGCFISSLLDPLDGARDCEKDGRITHETINKDNGDVSVTPQVQVSGEGGASVTSDPRTGRGQVGRNFERAVEGAILETRRQWDDFRDALKEKYGEEKGTAMIRAIVTDKEGDGEGNAAGKSAVSWAFAWTAAVLSVVALV